MLDPVLGVVLAFVAGAPAGGYAGLNNSARDVRVVLRLPADDVSGRRAHVGTVETQPNALDEALHVLFAQGLVGALRARL
jgi:hypothetical protein